MGCDIHTHAERKVDGKYEAIKDLHPFDWRSYAMFGWFADVRNYSDVPPLSDERGLPDDVSDSVRTEHMGWGGDAHTASWMSVEELTAFNYDQPVEDRRVMVQLAENVVSGAGTSDHGGGEMTTYREFLGPAFFRDLDALVSAGADRIVFWFDN
jgi:hypothetical protein